MAGFFQHGNECSDLINYRKYLDHLNGIQLPGGTPS
jgi:hypothetical protein